MQHQMIVLRGPRPTYLGAIYHTARMESVDGWRTHAQRLDRDSLLQVVSESLHDDGRALLEINVLSVDAWREGDGWQWNNWHKRGALTVREFKKLGATTLQERRRTLQWFREHGYLSDASKGAVTVCDDGYNLTVIDRRTDEPLYAIEYGAVLV